MAQATNVTNNVDNTESIRRAMSFLAQELLDFKNWAENMVKILAVKQDMEDCDIEHYEIRIRLTHAEMVWNDFVEKMISLVQIGGSDTSDLKKLAKDSYFRGSAILKKCGTVYQKAVGCINGKLVKLS